MAAEVDVSMSVRVFEELTSISSLDDGLLLIKMRPSYNVIGRHPNKTFDWQRFYFYVKCDDSAFEDPPDEDYRVLWNTLLGRIPLLTRVISSYTNRLLFSLRIPFERSCCCETRSRTLGKYFLGEGSPFHRSYFQE
ncbi:hypothetical protein Bca52824_072773 [Brassica carinata]|uniref:Uncharacterized protein n=1 Tax=Brassica carinata TaxID=52824 RepID=A0A8X7U589_BRACI|nr:hypothetical protein Bca52824_072773 [Brassica carinata]